jgi:hypothetical protein
VRQNPWLAGNELQADREVLSGGRDVMPMALSTHGAAGCQLIADVLQLSGKANVRVTGSSMLPCVLPGDILVVQREPLNGLALGDIALFTRHNRLFAHRVMDRGIVETPYLVTRGDSLYEHDPLVLPHEVLGRVSSIIRGPRRIKPHTTLLDRLASSLFMQSDFLTRCLLWLLCRTRSLREVTECLT